MRKKQIILFDGDCNFCNKSVRFIIKRDPKATFQFASLQSNIGKQLLKKYQLPEDINSMVLLYENHAYVKSTAVLKVASKLKGLWKLSALLLLIPRSIRDYFYQIVATNRYQWFGERTYCDIPSLSVRKRFL